MASFVFRQDSLCPAPLVKVERKITMENQNTDLTEAELADANSLDQGEGVEGVEGLEWHGEVEPWLEAVEGTALLDELAALIRRFVVLPKWADRTLALWVLHTY